MIAGNLKRTPLLRRRYFVAALAAVTIYLGCPFRLEVVRGDSMNPTLHDGSVCVLDRSYYTRHAMAPGDVIAFRMGDTLLSKRVYGAPGQIIELVQFPFDGTYGVPEPAMLSHLRRLSKSAFAIHSNWSPSLVRLDIPPGKCFVLGDNSAVSEDSRVFGLVDTNTVLGKMVAPSSVEGQ